MWMSIYAPLFTIFIYYLYIKKWREFFPNFFGFAELWSPSNNNKENVVGLVERQDKIVVEYNSLKQQKDIE